MNLWLLACLVVCFVGAWAPAVHAQGVFEDCCLAYQHHVKPSLRKRVLTYHRQVVSGSCNLRAVIFIYRNGRKTRKALCADPRDKWVQDWIQFLDKRKEAHGKPCPGNRKNPAVPCTGLMSKPSGHAKNSTRHS